MAGLTDSAAKAIECLPDCILDGITARDFAQKMWPNSKGWTTVSNVGHGATSGVGMQLVGGSYLSKLKDKGWVMSYYDDYNMIWSSTSKGRAALKEYNRSKT